MSKFLTEKEFLAKVKFNYEDKIQVLGKYSKATSRVKVRCNICGYIWEPLAWTLIKSTTSCKLCRSALTKQKSLKRAEIGFKKYLKDTKNNTIVLLGDYMGTEGKTLFKFKVCGHTAKTTPYAIKSSNSYNPCPKCFSLKGSPRKLTDIDYNRRVIQKYGYTYIVLEPYVNQDTKIKVWCTICKNIWLANPRDFPRKRKCPNCNDIRLSKGKLKSLKVVKEEIAKIDDGEYKLVGKYTGCYNHTLIKHNCGNIINPRYSDFLSGQSRCTKHNMSTGEHLCWVYLKQHDLVTNTSENYQIYFDDLKDVSKLSYDFGLIYQNKKYLIEYQGEQHYTPKTFGGHSEKIAKEKFKIQLYHDKLKRDYAKKHNYILIEIPYTVNTQEKVNKYLNKYLK